VRVGTDPEAPPRHGTVERPRLHPDSITEFYTITQPVRGRVPSAPTPSWDRWRPSDLATQRHFGAETKESYYSLFVHEAIVDSSKILER